MSARLTWSAALEYVEYDSALVRWAVATGGALAALTLWALRRRPTAMNMLSRIHRTGGSNRVTSRIQDELARLDRLERHGTPTGLWELYDEHIRRSACLPSATEIVREPVALLGYRVLVLKGARDGERGVVVIDYSYVFPLFAALFDIEAIAERYYIVLEPSWRGLCTLDILSYTRFRFPVFVQTIEPRDVAFIEGLRANLQVVPIAANWWVDHRLVKPLPGRARDIDLIMIAAWSDIKRHWRFFKVLADLRRRGHALKVALVGYRLDKSRAEVEAEVRHFGIADQVTFYEKLSLPEVGQLLARSRVHVLWSRKEGANRAIVEALFADVPIVLREGLSYGYPYPYVNSETGSFANEDTLADELLHVLSAPERYHPRAWAMANMSCQRATQVLQDVIRARVEADGGLWTRDLAVKTVHLESQRYWDPADMERFASDYEFLKTQLRSRPASACNEVLSDTVEPPHLEAGATNQRA